MIQKLVDTTNAMARAERELQFSPRFLRFVRGKFNLNEIKTINAEQVAKKYNLKGVIFGNYTTQEERHFYLYKVSKQMECLAMIRGNNNIGKGILTLSIGAAGVGGNIYAHYEPGQSLINLARGNKGDYTNFMKGENSFLHEYGHFLDFEQGRKHDKNLNHNFASENTNPNWPNKLTLRFSEPITIVKNDEGYMQKLKTPYLKKTIEIFARLFEASITHYINESGPSKYRQYDKFFNRLYEEKIYYPKNKILDESLDAAMIRVLQFSK